MALATAGARFTGGGAVTVTSKVSEIRRPPGSVAVTVTVAVPAATPVRLSVVPLRDTVAVPVLLDDADSVRASPSGSLNPSLSRSPSPCPRPPP